MNVLWCGTWLITVCVASMYRCINIWCHIYLQGLLRRAARLLLQLSRLKGFDVFVTLLVTIIQQVLFGL